MFNLSQAKAVLERRVEACYQAKLAEYEAKMRERQAKTKQVDNYQSLTGGSWSGM